MQVKNSTGIVNTGPFLTQFTLGDLLPSCFIQQTALSLNNAVWLGFSLALTDLRSEGCCADSQSGFWKHLWKRAHSIPVMKLTTSVTFSLSQHAISLTSQMPTCLVYPAPCPAWKPLPTLLAGPHSDLCALLLLKTTYSRSPWNPDAQKTRDTPSLCHSQVGHKSTEQIRILIQVKEGGLMSQAGWE